MGAIWGLHKLSDKICIPTALKNKIAQAVACAYLKLLHWVTIHDGK